MRVVSATHFQRRSLSWEATTRLCQLRIPQEPNSFWLFSILKQTKLTQEDGQVSPEVPAPQSADAGRGELGVHTHSLGSACRMCGGLALTPRLLLVEPEQGVQLLFWSNSTNSGHISQHKRVRKPFCYRKKLKDLLRIGQLIFSDLVLSNIPCALWRFCNLLYATAT